MYLLHLFLSVLFTLISGSCHASIKKQNFSKHVDMPPYTIASCPPCIAKNMQSKHASKPLKPLYMQSIYNLYPIISTRHKKPYNRSKAYNLVIITDWMITFILLRNVNLESLAGVGFSDFPVKNLKNSQVFNWQFFCRWYNGHGGTQCPQRTLKIEYLFKLFQRALR